MKVNKLHASQLETLKAGLHNDGNGLYLRVKETSAATSTRSWVFRYRDKLTQRLREKGLGPLRDVTLRQARHLALAQLASLRAGVDPIDAPRAAHRASQQALAQQRTFGSCAEACILERRAGWRNPKHAKQWDSTLRTYAASLWNLPVAQIDTKSVKDCLLPHWHTKRETASRVQQRIAAVLGWAIAHGYREGPNPGQWAGLLDKILSTERPEVQHRGSVDYAEIAHVCRQLAEKDTCASRALLFQILTACRPGEACSASWDEISLAERKWTIPAHRTKTKVKHEVPLSTQAIEFLTAEPASQDFVFTATRGRPITTAATLKLLRELRGSSVTCHGFRSTFRNWAAENTFESDVAELALAHALPAVKAAYHRTRLYQKRETLMQTWADYCLPPPKTPSPSEPSA